MNHSCQFLGRTFRISWNLLLELQLYVRVGAKSGAKSFMCYISPRIHQRFHAYSGGNPLPLVESFFPCTSKHLQNEDASKVTAFHQSSKPRWKLGKNWILKHHPTIGA